MKSNTSKFLVISHRGAMGYETENSIKSIQKALDLGVSMIELDIIQLCSGELIVFHDKELARISNSSGLIESYTFKRLRDTVRLKDGQNIPLLKEVLDLCASKTWINIEIKTSNTAKALHVLLQCYFKQKILKESDILISSFIWDELIVLRHLNPSIPIGILSDQDPLAAIPIAKRLKATSIHPFYLSLHKNNVQQLHKEGFKIYAWVVNTLAEIKILKDWKVDGVFSNYPDLI